MPQARQTEINEHSRLNLPLEAHWKVLTAIAVILAGFWGVLNGTVATAAQGLRQEQTQALKPFLTREEYQKAREEDFKYWNSQLGDMRKDLGGKMDRILLEVQRR